MASNIDKQRAVQSIAQNVLEALGPTIQALEINLSKCEQSHGLIAGASRFSKTQFYLTLRRRYLAYGAR